MDYVLLDGFVNDLFEFSVCFWMQTEDRDNYGTPFSYATASEDNEVRRASLVMLILLLLADYHRLQWVRYLYLWGEGGDGRDG